MTKISKKTFSGSSNVFNGVLADAIMGLARFQAIQAVAYVNTPTDSTGGDDAAPFVAPPALTSFTAGTTDATAKAEFEATLTAVRINLRQLIVTLNLMLDRAPVFPALVSNLGGSAPGGTLIAIDDVMTGTSTGGSLVSFAGAVAAVKAALAAQAQLLYWVNKMRVAFGLEPIASTITSASLGVTISESNTFAALSTSTGTASTGAATVSKAAADITLDQLADNLAVLAKAMNDITVIPPAATVVVG